ncbi:MAG: transglycosylase domain-containing protein, partial [Bacteroidota bacterium]
PGSQLENLVRQYESGRSDLPFVVKLIGALESANDQRASEIGSKFVSSLTSFDNPDVYPLLRQYVSDPTSPAFASILALYASHAPFGGNVVGIEAASWRYYGKRPALLSWAEAATLAVLPNSPAIIHPGRNRDALLAKRNRLLDRLRESGAISEDQCFYAKEESLPEAPLPLSQLA